MTDLASAILIRDLVVRYGRRLGVDGVDLDVPTGSLFGFLGPNGAGKSTTIRTMLGFLRAARGTASVLELDCWHQSKVIKREVSYLPGDVRLYPWLTAERALRLLSAVRGEDVKRAGYELVERLQLDPTVRVRQMSRGMRQKLGLILALAPLTKLLVLDEPTTGLDPITQLELGRILRARVASAGATVFFSSHTLSEVEQLCDRVAIVRAGKVVEAATILDLQSRAMRQIQIRFASAADLDAVKLPKLLQLVERQSTTLIAEFEGAATGLLEWLQAQTSIVDFAISAPDLETLFHRYYRDDAPAVALASAEEQGEAIVC